MDWSHFASVTWPGLKSILELIVIILFCSAFWHFSLGNRTFRIIISEPLRQTPRPVWLNAQNCWPFGLNTSLLDRRFEQILILWPDLVLNQLILQLKGQFFYLNGSHRAGHHGPHPPNGQNMSKWHSLGRDFASEIWPCIFPKFWWWGSIRTWYQES